MLGRQGGVNQEGRGGRESVPKLGKTASTEVQRQKRAQTKRSSAAEPFREGMMPREESGGADRLCKIYIFGYATGLTGF